MIRMNAQVDPRKIGILVITASIVLSLIFSLFHHQIVRYFEFYLSSDHKISPNGERDLIATYYFGMVLLLGFGFLKVQNISWNGKMRQIFLGEPLYRPTPVQPPLPRLTLILSSLVGLLLIVSMRFVSPRFPPLFQFLYAKDHGVFDLFVPITMVISAVLLSTAVWKLWKEPKFAKLRAYVSGVYLFMMGLLIVYAGEETSWGQDFFGWQTPTVLSGNVEGQTNLHNYFNAYFDYGYIALSLVLVVVLLSVWLESKQHWLPFNRLLLPHPSLIGLSLLIAFVAIVWYPEQELLEEMMAVFVLFYSFRIFTCFRSKSLSIEV